MNKTLLLLALVLLNQIPCRGEEPPAERPRIGLVLGGGGALGEAHIGVLKVLEELRIPIDYIAGTSMGSIIAGLYASGMSPGEIEQFLKAQDWDEVMSDKTPRRELHFRRKADDQRYLFEMGVKKTGLALGTGMAAGQKFNNLMQFATLRSAAVTNFDQLPIPYRAVATDLKSGTPYVIDRGNLATAMRASMAVPGAFTPVEIEGHLLVDGGIVDNLPVDVAQAMGAEVIIAVDVGSESEHVRDEDLKTLGGILGRTYSIAQRPEQLEMLRKADVGIQPDLAGFTATQFDRVTEFVPQGEQAARAKSNELSRYSVSEEEYTTYLGRQRQAQPTAIPISAVTVSGNQRVDERVIRGRIYSKPGQTFDQKEVELDLMRVYGIGEFEQVLCQVRPNGDDTSTLDYQLKEKAWGPTYFKYGLQLRSDFEQDADWRMLINFTSMSLNQLGAEWRNELQLGSSKNILSEFYQPLDAQGILFVAPSVDYTSELQNLYEGDQRVAEYDVQTLEGRLDLGLQLRRYAEVRVGPFWGRGKARVETGTSDLPEPDEDLAGWRAGLTVDRQDRTLFAREGYYLKAEGQFASEDVGGDRSFDKVSVNYRHQASWGDHTFALGLQGGSSLGDDLPGYAQFTLGGPFGFAGLAEDQFRGSYLGVASLAYRYRLLELPPKLGRGVYALTRLDEGNVWPDDFDTGDLRTGLAVGLGADTALGPVFLFIGRADGGYSRIYFSLGTAF
jgi:NTE family protein